MITNNNKNNNKGASLFRPYRYMVTVIIYYKLMQLQTLLLLLLAFSSLLNTGQFVLACRGFAISGTVHAELLCTCVASVRVQTLVACICRFACAVAWRQRLSPYLESPPACDGLQNDQKVFVFWATGCCFRQMATIWQKTSLAFLWQLTEITCSWTNYSGTPFKNHSPPPRRKQPKGRPWSWVHGPFFIK